MTDVFTRQARALLKAPPGVCRGGIRSRPVTDWKFVGDVGEPRERGRRWGESAGDDIRDQDVARAVVNLLSDPLQAHAAAGVLATEAKATPST
jgi:hypothetical protein